MSRAYSLFQRDRSRTKPRGVVYEAFEQLDGTHPFKEALPEGFVEYSVRELPRGKVSYFNYALAREMGLIAENHPNDLNKTLEEKILKTFSLRIINEYDEAHHIQYAPETIKKNKYMATRYLQLQHSSRTGKTSGDGRCIWNGVVEHKGVCWDVSSRGTGVTRLSPGFVEAGRPIRSGNTLFGYGCGLAEIDELYGAAIMAEIFHNNGLETERVLCIIDLGRGVGIGVRAAQNLLRPAHLFLYSKQNNLDALRRGADYLIQRQVQNGAWKMSLQSPKKYDRMLEYVCEGFANFAAILDREYIFAWLDWDGDNVLATGGIIDYGSVRQFGLRHDQYRYDDVDRFSTTLTEQRQKARLIVQVFVQIVDFLKTGQRKSVQSFRRHPQLARFDILFDRHLKDRFLFHMGLSQPDRDFLLLRHRSAVDKFFTTYTFLEELKSVRGTLKVADGINRPAVFNMRSFNRNIAHLLTESSHPHAVHYVWRLLLADSATRRDRKRTSNTRIQKTVRRLLLEAVGLIKRLETGDRTFSQILNEIQPRAARINHENRMTGNALINIVHEILQHRKRGVADSEIQKIMDSLIAFQSLSKEEAGGSNAKTTKSSSWAERSQRLMRTLLTVLDGHKEDI